MEVVEMDEKIKIAVVSTGVMVVGIGANYLDKMPKVGITVIITGAFIIGMGIFWIVHQFNEKIKKLEEAIKQSAIS